MSDPAASATPAKPDRIELAYDRRPWDRQPNEPARAFESFAVYRGLGSKRSIAAAARQTQRSERTAQGWAQTYRWEERAAAWDRQLDRERQEKQRGAIQQTNEDFGNLARTMLSKSAQRLLKLTDEQVAAMSIWELAKLVQVSFNVWRLASGQSTANVDVHLDQEKARMLVAVITEVIDSPELGLDADGRQVAYRMLTAKMRSLEAGQEGGA